MSTHSLCFEQKYENYLNFSSENFHFLVVKIFSIFKQACFRNDISSLVTIQFKNLFSS